MTYAPALYRKQYNVCGNPTCRCKATPPVKHGPYYQISFTWKGKTDRNLFRDDEASRQLENYRQRELVDEWVALSTESLEKRIRNIKNQISDLGDLHPGALSKHYNICGNPRCHCKADPPIKHGPYYQVSFTLLDFKRNTVYIADYPGGASLPPGMPFFKGPQVLADYLSARGIRYILYSYGNEANFSRKGHSERLGPQVNAWVRTEAEHTFDFQDNLKELADNGKKLYDDGNNFVLELK